MVKFCKLLLLFPTAFLLLAAKPVGISDAEQLAKVDPNGSYFLLTDIDMENWQAIDFYGELDGQGYSLKNLKTSLFGRLEGAVVKNLQIEDINVYAQGALANAVKDSELEQIRVTGGKVSGSGYVGGLIGKGEGVTITNCVSDVTVSAFFTGRETVLGGLASSLIDCTVVDSSSSGMPILTASRGNIGGFVGQAEDTVFKGCRSNRDVKGRDNVGGFAGFLEGKGLLIGCYSSGDVYGERNVGGFVGLAKGDAITENANHSIKMIQCHSSGNAEARRGTAGGFGGMVSYVSASACSAEGEVSGFESGGFIGRVADKSRITNSGALGDVAGEKSAGGFVGLVTFGSGIEYSLSAGDVSGGEHTGGFAGMIPDSGEPTTLFGCMSFARWVSSDDAETVNRLVGKMEHAGVNNCYAYLGGVVAGGKRLLHVTPNAYGADGGDFNNQTIENILNRLGWDAHYWSFGWNGDKSGDLLKPSIIFLDK